jgi:diguanylate cyclase (GGDEF)-like protein/PAS domain S-box-containing protein
VRIEKNADLANAAGARLATGAAPHQCDTGIASAVFQRLAGADNIAALFDAMLALSAQYGAAARAQIVVQDAGAYRAAASLPAQASSAAPAWMAGHMAARYAPGRAVVVEYKNSIGVVIALAAGPAPTFLCVEQAALPSQACLEILILIAAGGAALQDKLDRLETRLSLARHLGDERSLLRTLIDNMPDQIYVKDTDGRFVLGNAAAADCIGVAAPEDLIGKSDLELFPGECGQRFFLDEQTLIASGQPIVDQVEENINQAGVRRWYSTTKVPFQDEHGKVIGLVGMSRDVTLRMVADEAIRLRNRAIESSLDAIVITSCLKPGNPVVYVNPAFERIFGFSFDEALLGGIERLIENGGQAAPPELLLAMHDQCEGRAVLHSRRRDDGEFWNDVRFAPVCDIAGRATHFVFTMSDITKARDTEEKLERMASHDALTGLPNRRMLMDRLGQALALAERGSFVLAVAFIDLDRLKYVNDNLGHEAGDVLLKTVAGRMAACVRKSDTVARLGGDEFVLVSVHRPCLQAAGQYPHIHDMLAKVQAALGEPVLLGDTPFSVTCSIGVSVFAQHGADPDSLLKNADAAMYLAKKQGRNRIVFYAGEPAAPLEVLVRNGGGPSRSGL